MPRQTHLALRPRTIHGAQFWQVTVPKPGTGRTLRTFKDKREAQTFFQLKGIELKNSGTEAAALTAKFRGDALSAAEILAPFAASLTDAARFFAQAHERQQKSETVSNALRAFLAQKETSARERYMSDLRSRLSRFSKSFPQRKLASFSPGEIEDWLSSLPNLKRGGSLAPLGYNTYLLRLSSLWTYALNRGWVSENIIAKIPKAKHRGSEIGILPPEEAARLFRVS